MRNQTDSGLCAELPSALVTQPLVVAIDGPVASGKTSVGKRVAAVLGIPFVDSGLAYRALSWLAVEAGYGPADEAAIARMARSVELRIADGRVFAGARDLTDLVYRPEVNTIISPLSAMASVREVLLDQLRAQAEQGVVMVGRDIGTVVFPSTPHKFFLMVSEEERIARRRDQFIRQGMEAVAAQARAEADVRNRDAADTRRAVAPLRPAEDAIMVMADGTLEQVVALVLDSLPAPALERGHSLDRL